MEQRTEERRRRAAAAQGEEGRASVREESVAEGERDIREQVLRLPAGRRFDSTEAKGGGEGGRRAGARRGPRAQPVVAAHVRQTLEDEEQQLGQQPAQPARRRHPRAQRAPPHRLFVLLLLRAARARRRRHAFLGKVGGRADGRRALFDERSELRLRRRLRRRRPLRRRNLILGEHERRCAHHRLPRSTRAAGARHKSAKRVGILAVAGALSGLPKLGDRPRRDGGAAAEQEDGACCRRVLGRMRDQQHGTAAKQGVGAAEERIEHEAARRAIERREDVVQ